MVFEALPAKLKGVFNDCGDRCQLEGITTPFPCEVAQGLDDRGDAHGSVLDDPRASREVIEMHVSALGHSSKLSGPAVEHSKGIVNFVSHAAGHFAEGRKL